MNKRRSKSAGATPRAEDDFECYQDRVENLTYSSIGRAVGVPKWTSYNKSRRTQNELDRKEEKVMADLREIDEHIEIQMKDDQRYTLHTIGANKLVDDFENMADSFFPYESLDSPAMCSNGNNDMEVDDMEVDDMEVDENIGLNPDDLDEEVAANLNLNNHVNSDEDDNVNFDEPNSVNVDYDDDDDDDIETFNSYKVMTLDDDYADYKNGGEVYEREHEEVIDESQFPTFEQHLHLDPDSEPIPHGLFAKPLTKNIYWKNVIRNIYLTKNTIDMERNKMDDRLMNDVSPDWLNELVDPQLTDTSPLSDILVGLRKYAYGQPIFDAILKSDENAFFNEVLKSDVSKSGCDVCFCKQSDFKRIGKNRNLLYIAVAVSTTKFVKNIVDPTLSRQFLQPDKSGRNEAILNHYQDTIDYWLHMRYYDMTPTCLAAELDKIDVVSILLNYSDKNKIIYEYSKTRMHPLLFTLVRNRSLYKLSPRKIEEKLLEEADDYQLFTALKIAAQVGDLERLIKLYNDLVQRQLEELQDDKKKENDKRSKKHFLPGRFTPDIMDFQNHRDRSEDSTIAQLMAENAEEENIELIEQFENLNVNEKTEMDALGWTSLSFLLNFSDDIVEKQLRNYYRVKREEIFFFISQVIIKNRLNLLEGALRMAFSNPKNFEKKTIMYKSYNLPEYIYLPMETALSRTGDMSIVERIAKFYMTQDRYARPVIKEDALRCIKSIQDKASQLSDHIRLAVILMMKQFVNTSGDDFTGFMKMYRQQGINDPVEYYALTHLVQDTQRYDPRSFTTWKYAFEKAGSVVKQWSIVETELPMNILEKTRTNSIRVPESILVKPMSADQKKQKEQMKAEKRKTQKEKHGRDIAEAIRRMDELEIN